MSCKQESDFPNHQSGLKSSDLTCNTGAVVIFASNSLASPPTSASIAVTQIGRIPIKNSANYF